MMKKIKNLKGSEFIVILGLSVLIIPDMSIFVCADNIVS